MRLIAVTLNGVTKFIHMRQCADGFYRLSWEEVERYWGIKRGDGIRFS